MINYAILQSVRVKNSKRNKNGRNKIQDTKVDIRQQIFYIDDRFHRGVMLYTA
jgi:hypothetical protein